MSCSALVPVSSSVAHCRSTQCRKVFKSEISESAESGVIRIVSADVTLQIVIQPFPSASMRPASLGVQSTLKRVQLDVTVRTGRLAIAGVEALSSLFNLEVRLAAPRYHWRWLMQTLVMNSCRYSCTEALPSA